MVAENTTLWSGLGPTPSVALLRAIRRLRVVCNVLCIAAHPDDENTRLLSWLVHHENVKTGYLSLTRGEGGQNLLGPERAPLLGLIRVQELLAARRIDGAEQFFGRCPDFGYSKSRDETLSRWDRERTLADIVAVIRYFRPDVILTRFSPDEQDTHAHHTTSALLAVEAFGAAADPTRFRELGTLPPWQASRVIWNWFTLGTPPAPIAIEDFFTVEVGGYDPLLGESYPEVAARSLTMHRTQGFGSTGVRGSALEYFRVLAGAPATTSLFEGLDRSWARVPGGATLDALLTRASADYQLERPYESVPRLLEALDALDAMPDHPWKIRKRQELSDTIVACAAVHTSAHVKTGQVTSGSRSPLTVDVVSRSPVPVLVQSIRMRNAGAKSVVLATERMLEENVPLDVAGEILWAGSPGEPGVEVDVELRVGAGALTVTRPVVHSWIDPIVGERWEPVVVVPRVTITPRLPTMALPDDRARTIEVQLRAFDDAGSGTVRVEPPPGAIIEPREQPFSLPHAGAEQRLAFVIRQAASGRLRFTVDGVEGRELIRLDYPHIPPITMTRPAEVTLVCFSMSRAGERIGYVAGTGDDVAQSLRQVGYQVTALTDESIEAGSLTDYDAIVTGIRAFNSSQHLAALMPRLLGYVEAGGTLVVQYNTNTLLNALTAAIGPYPFTIGEDRVCEENAEVTLRDPDHPIFTRPNRIGPEDFAGWVQERGLCFGSKWDRHYTSLLSLHDHGEPPRDGGLLVTSHGRGRLVYTGLAFFRQLPAGVPGAYRLFANLLARQGG